MVTEAGGRIGTLFPSAINSCRYSNPIKNTTKPDSKFSRIQLYLTCL